MPDTDNSGRLSAMKENNNVNNVNEQIEKEALFGVAPVLGKEKLYGFLDVDYSQ